MPEYKPVIGITTDLIDKYYGIEATYSDSIASAGGIPLLIPSVYKNKRTLRQFAIHIDGLLIPGSRDMDPKYYRQKPHSKLNPMNGERTTAEFIVLEESVKNNVPVLGICGGMQFINVFFGGSLYQDIQSLMPAASSHEKGAIHKINILKGSLLETILGKSTIDVSSYHHQAIKKVGSGLVVSARSGDNIIEALENQDNNIIAVQWHPELTRDVYSDKLFKYFISRAASLSDSN